MQSEYSLSELARGFNLTPARLRKIMVENGIEPLRKAGHFQYYSIAQKEQLERILGVKANA